MRTLIDDAEFWRQLATYQRSAWRFEQQPAYAVDYEDEQFAGFLAGRPQPPTENRELGEWMSQVARQTAEGKTMGRVRIVDDPITDYQRWMQWMDRWNREAGETIDYLDRATARAAGLPVDGGPDWWLFDDERLMVMSYDDRHRRIEVELLVGEPEVGEALEVRRLAIETARRSPACA